MVADPCLLTGVDNLRVELFQLFTKNWSLLSINEKTESPNPSLPPEQRLVKLTPPARQAFLLMAVERFSEEDWAKILDCDIATVHRLVGECGRELAAEIATNVLIIEDETLIAIELEGWLKVLAILQSAWHARMRKPSRWRQLPPGLIFGGHSVGRWQLGA